MNMTNHTDPTTQCPASVKRQTGAFNRGVAAWEQQTCLKPRQDGSAWCKLHTTLSDKRHQANLKELARCQDFMASLLEAHADGSHDGAPYIRQTARCPECWEARKNV